MQNAFVHRILVLDVSHRTRELPKYAFEVCAFCTRSPSLTEARLAVLTLPWGGSGGEGHPSLSSTGMVLTLQPSSWRCSRTAPQKISEGVRPFVR